ncbi:tetraketide alpha-pyrone reductase 2-like protein [Trifolium pratense]|uniref:Tetraketide alpha-pyrone reductase 2-like protein n=1 Tax=Trifolium pratense TaxID=57577 RepID=A0A2K3MVW7_TRIPR|nr:tetraketide alpha-pyrone reductase 2-like protein [Trifolium pratense]
MGVVGTCEIRRSELEVFHRNLVATAGIHRRKDDEGLRKNNSFDSSLDDDDDDDKGTTLVCVTSGVSYLGLALVNHLLVLGYSVRITVDNPGVNKKL